MEPKQKRKPVSEMTREERLALIAFKNVQEKKTKSNSSTVSSQITSVKEAQEYLALISKKGDKRLKAREELSKQPLSSKQIDERLNQIWAAHGKPNPNKPRGNN